MAASLAITRRNEGVQRRNSLLQLPRDSDTTTHEQCLSLVELFISNCAKDDRTGDKMGMKMDRYKFVATFAENLTEEIFCSRFFDYLTTSICVDTDDHGSPRIRELDVNVFAISVLRFLEMDKRDRKDFIIKIFDINGDGSISVTELLPLVKAAFVESDIDTAEDHLQLAIKNIIDAYHQETNIHEDGLSYSAVRAIMDECLSELAGIFEKSLPDTQSNNMESSSTVKRRNSYAKVPTKSLSASIGSDCNNDIHTQRSCGARIAKILKMMDYQWLFHRPRLIWLLVYIISNILVFDIKFLVWRLSPQYQSTRNLVGNSICWAKGFAELSSFNSGLIFFPVCRKFVSMLRDNTPFKLWKWVPFNDNIDFHMICGHVIMFAGLGHTIAHLINFYRYSTEPDDELWYASPLNGNMKGPRPTFWDVLRTLPGATGFIMIFIMVIAYPIAVFLRRSHFNLFWYSHTLYLLWTIAFICHGMRRIFQAPHAIWYILPGFVIYLGERLQRLLCQSDTKVKVLRAETFDNTTVLYIQKPSRRRFDFTMPGSYALLNVSTIALFEWHPFTISSAPGDDYLRFHIRRAGDWTTRLYDEVRLFEEGNSKHRKISFVSDITFQESDDESSSDGGEHNEHMNSKISSDMEKFFSGVHIQGPFGAPTNDFFRYEYLVLIGLGVGVTPFASILRHLLLTWQSYSCPQCRAINYNMINQKFVQFHWLTKEHESLSWFSKELSELAKLDTERRLEIHQYLTSIKSRTAARQLVSSIQGAVHRISNEDIISGVTGSAQLTHFGRPDWRATFREVSKRFPKKNVGVFFCGPPVAQEAVLLACKEMSRSKKEGGTKFVFYHENF